MRIAVGPTKSYTIIWMGSNLIMYERLRELLPVSSEVLIIVSSLGKIPKIPRSPYRFDMEGEFQMNAVPIWVIELTREIRA